MDERQFSEILSKLDSILKLLAINTVKGVSLKEQVAFLSSVGFQPKQMADMLGKTPNHISVVLHEIRKGKRLQEEGAEVPDSESETPEQ